MLLAVGKHPAAWSGMARCLCWPCSACPEAVRWGRQNIQGLHSLSLFQVVHNTENPSMPMNSFSTYPGGTGRPLGLQC